jgi:hypothetical protein
MSDVLVLLIEISSLTDTSDAPWTDDIKVGVCTIMNHLLSRNCPMHSFVVHDSRREDCVTIALRMTGVVNQGNDKLELRRTLHTKLSSLTSKLICMALNADTNAVLRYAVDKDTATQSLMQQLKL